MKQKRLFKSPLGGQAGLARGLLYATAVLLMSVSCKKETEPQIEGFVCDDGSCCNPEFIGVRYRHIRTLEGALAALSCGDINCSLVFKDKIRDPKLDNTPLPTFGRDWVRKISICPVTENLVKGLPAYYYAHEDSVEYNYRVWGKVYENVDARCFLYPCFDFSLEKIEKIP